MRFVESRVVALALGLAWVALVGCKAPTPLPPKAVELNRLGSVAFSLGDLETAEIRFALAIEYHPRFTEAWVNLGLVELGRGNFVLAKKDFEKARSLNADLPAPHHALGLLADRRGDFEVAEKHYRDALKVDPGFAPARANLGRLYFRRAAFDDAREQFERLTEVAPESSEGWIGLTECFVRLGREDDADHALARGRTEVGDLPEIELLVARQLLRRGAFAQAEEILAPLTAHADPERQAAAWSWIAVARLGEGRPESAVQAASQALQADRDEVLPNHVMSAALEARGLPELADHWAARARELGQRSALSHGSSNGQRNRSLTGTGSAQ
jgi:tetratricopeptide (TPR) repeat protein